MGISASRKGIDRGAGISETRDKNSVCRFFPGKILIREVRRGIERNAFGRQVGQIFGANDYDWIVDRGESSGGAIYLALRRAVFFAV